MHTPEQLTTLLREHGHRVTAQRQCIFRILEGNTNHPSAEDVYQAARSTMSTISLKTVYQTLNELAEMGEISLLDLGTGTARFDPNVETVHHHLVCRSCGLVRDLNVDIGLPEVPDGAEQGFLIETAQVVFRGLCSSCATSRTELLDRTVHRRRVASTSRSELLVHGRSVDTAEHGSVDTAEHSSQDDTQVTGLDGKRVAK